MLCQGSKEALPEQLAHLGKQRGGAALWAHLGKASQAGGKTPFLEGAADVASIPSLSFH